MLRNKILQNEMLRKIGFVILTILMVSCEKNNELSVISDGEEKLIVLQKPDSSKLVIVLNDKFTMNRVSTINKGNKKNGEFLEYYDDGVPFRKSKWINGIQVGVEKMYHKEGWLQWVYHYSDNQKNGSMYEYWKNGELKQHKIYNKEELVYTSIHYDGGKKNESIFPFVVNESKNGQGYKGVFRFPISFPGEMEIYLRDTMDFNTKLIDKQTFEITINDENDLQKFDMRFIYHPTENDTLIPSEYIYEHTLGDRHIDKIDLNK